MKSSIPKTHLLIAAIIVIASAGIAILVARQTIHPSAKSFLIHARKYEYDPPVIHLVQGDTVHIRLVTLDVVHGFFLEGHGIDAHIFPSPPHMELRDPEHPDSLRTADEIVFIASKTGKFRYRCSVTCGLLHPFMQGEMIVGPNYTLHAGIGSAIGMLLAGFYLLYCRRETDQQARAGADKPTTHDG